MFSDARTFSIKLDEKNEERDRKMIDKLQGRRDLAYIEFLVDEFEKTCSEESSENTEYGLDTIDEYVAKELDGNSWLTTVDNGDGRTQNPSERHLQPSDYMLAMLILSHGLVTDKGSFSTLWREMLNTTNPKKNDGSNDSKREGDDSRFLNSMQLVFIILLGCREVCKKN